MNTAFDPTLMKNLLLLLIGLVPLVLFGLGVYFLCRMFPQQARLVKVLGGATFAIVVAIPVLLLFYVGGAHSGSGVIPGEAHHVSVEIDRGQLELAAAENDNPVQGSPQLEIQSEVISTQTHRGIQTYQSARGVAAIVCLSLVLATGGVIVWLLYRSDKFRIVASSLLVGLFGFGMLVVLGIGLKLLGTTLLSESSLVSTSTGETIQVQHPGELLAFLTSSATVYGVIAGIISIITAFAVYVYLVSRKPVERQRSGNLIESAMWALPVLFISAMVLIQFMNQQQPYDDQLMVDIPVAKVDLKPPHGGFGEGNLLETSNDLLPDQLKKKVTPLPTDVTAGNELVSTVNLEYPDWINRGDAMLLSDPENVSVFRFTVMSDLFDTNEAAFNDALQRLSNRAVTLFNKTRTDSGITTIPEELLTQSAIIHTFNASGLVSTGQNKFPMYRVWLDCELSTLPDRQPYQYWTQVLILQRMVKLASLIGFFVLMFVALSALFRLNHFSQRKFEKRLKLAYIILVLVAGLGVMSVNA
ncbi:MAG: hypothetical protein R3C11_02570 [Planctomycetaceae bacterium]